MKRRGRRVAWGRVWKSGGGRRGSEWRLGVVDGMEVGVVDGG